MSVEPEAILSFWFGELDEHGMPSGETSQKWWKKDAELDAEIERRFGSAIATAESGELREWREQPRSALALVILLDQFTRNTRRGSAEMYSADPQALAVTRDAIDRGHDRALRPIERQFLYMPLMHAEDLDAQNECVRRFEALRDEAPEARREYWENAVGFAVQHRDIVERFGRFPHRNEILGRSSTPEELEFLEQPGSSF